MNKKSVTLGVALLMSGVAMAQTAVLGHVSDSEGTPIVNAAVRIGTRTVALTDGKGNFSLAKVPAGTKTITIAYVGMKPRTMEISKNGTMNVVLEWDDSNLNEAIVVAYGTAKKASFTGSAATMNAQKLENRQVSDVSRALNGTVAGVQTTSNNGQPGTSATIRVRGFGSINATMSPLIVLDGVPYDGDISSINPNDIENVSVLKDAASAALYGARGANGVMLITTKKGKSGDAKVQFEGRWGVNSREIPNYDVVRDAKDYVTHLYHSLYNEDIYNNGLSAERAAQRTNPRIQKALGYPVFSTPEGELLFDANGNFNPRATLGYMVRDKQGNPLNLLRPDNWEKEIFRQNTRQEYNLSVSGGNERFNYYWGSGYLNDEGIIDNSGYKRYSTRLNAERLPRRADQQGSHQLGQRLLHRQQHGSCLSHVCAQPRRQLRPPSHHRPADLRLRRRTDRSLQAQLHVDLQPRGRLDQQPPRIPHRSLHRSLVCQCDAPQGLDAHGLFGSHGRQQARALGHFVPRRPVGQFRW